MSSLKWLKVWLCLIAFPLFGFSQEIAEVDFDSSLKRYGLSEKTYSRFFEAERYAIGFKEIRKSIIIFRDQYSKLQKYLSSEGTDHQIPKVVHQIWLGKPMPDKFKPLIQTWAEIEGWKYKLWTKSELTDFVMVNRDLFDEARDYGEASDILRLEILFQEGGLYVDTDFECLESQFFDSIHNKLDFYASFEPLEHGGFKICNAIMASKKGHALVGKMIKELKSNCEKHKDGTTVERTGPNFITSVIFNYYKKSHSTRDIFFPPTFFYPTNKNEVHDGKYILFPESVAFHYWSGSWIGTVVKP